MTRRFNKLLLLVAVIVAAPFGWFMLDASTTKGGTMPVTIAQLRVLAGSLPGSMPQDAHYETIGRRRVVGDLLAAGSGLRPVGYAVRAYELVAPDGRIITIDHGMSRELAERHRLSDFDPVAQALVSRAVASAETSLLLSWEPQHSGMATVPAVAQTARRSDRVTNAEVPYAVAAGVVAIPTDGIRPGACMVYARLGDGREILFTGDVAPANVSWSEQRPPARLVTTALAPGNREQIATWLRTIQSLKAAAPDLQIVTGHDTALPRLLKHGFIEHDLEKQWGGEPQLRR